MFEEQEDNITWAIKKGLIKICPKHKKPHDANIECPLCKRENKKDIFKNIIWPEGDSMK